MVASGRFDRSRHCNITVAMGYTGVRRETGKE
jgi:hypothetical protein